MSRSARGLGYLVMIYLLGFAQIPSLIAAVALTATSIGVSLAMWRQHEALGTRKGQILTDVAEMDDLSGVALMVLLFAILPVLRETEDAVSANGEIFRALLGTGGAFFLSFVLFAGLCIAFARYGEERLTTAFKRFASQPELMVFVAGIAILIAGVAAWLEFSAALGALFAGLAFSRDPEAVNIDAGFSGVYHLLAPFFFIGIGLAVEVDAIGGGALDRSRTDAGRDRGQGSRRCHSQPAHHRFGRGDPDRRKPRAARGNNHDHHGACAATRRLGRACRVVCRFRAGISAHLPRGADRARALVSALARRCTLMKAPAAAVSFSP